MVDPKQGQDIASVDDAEVNFLQHKTGRTRADIVGAIRRVGHDRRNVLKELGKIDEVRTETCQPITR